METLAFATATLVTLLAALQVVRAPNLVHATLWLGLALLGTAGLFATLDASFLAGVQVLLYIGGVMTLTLFGVMITRRHETLLVPAVAEGTGRAAFASLALFGAVAWAIVKTPGLDTPAQGFPALTKDLGHAIVSTHVLAFEVLSVLLLAAIVGAIVIARRKDPLLGAAPLAPPASLSTAVPASRHAEAAE